MGANGEIMGFSFQHLIAVASGGAFGAVARYLMMIGVGHWFDWVLG